MNKILLLPLLLFFSKVGTCQYSADFTVNTQNICQGEVLDFTSSSQPSPSTSWHWDFGDGDTSILQHPSHIYLNQGQYNVILIASDGVSIDTITKSNFIDIYPNPVADF
tara:strand:+ start:60 stop:386 length:327 start_codon:yes stop_codon:yes gene_type:complete